MMINGRSQAKQHDEMPASHLGMARVLMVTERKILLHAGKRIIVGVHHWIDENGSIQWGNGHYHNDDLVSAVADMQRD